MSSVPTRSGTPAGATAVRRGRAGSPTLRLERQLQREGYDVLVGMDEVGRGALAGPVSVGVVAIDARSRSAPAGVRDSKLLTPAARRRLVPRVQRWCLGWGVGHAGPAEIDAFGIMVALRLAGQRALAQLRVRADLVILDGNHDWLTDPRRTGLLALVAEDGPHCPPVRTMTKADLHCSSVAAASVLAKVSRDDLMTGLDPEHPAYRWALNKGYAAPEHQAALRDLGPCEHHRRSWNLLGTAQEVSLG